MEAPRRRRGRGIALAVIGGAVLGLALASCGEDEKAMTAAAPAEEGVQFASLDECMQIYAEKVCKDAMSGAKPVFAQRQSCETAAGGAGCQEMRREDGTSAWLPLVAGMIVGNILSGGQREPIYVPRQSLPDGGRAAGRVGGAPRVIPPPRSDPTLAGGWGGWSSGSRGGGSVASTVQRSPSAGAPRASSSGGTVQRGIFGSTGSSRSYSLGG